MELTDEMIEQANQRGAEARKRNPVATSVRYDRRIGRVVIALSSGLELAFSPHLAQGLEAAKPSDLQEAEISPSGLGVHFPKLDADLYLPALLEGLLGSANWAASKLGAEGGKAKSPAKVAAARANGTKGGRPRKNVSAAA